LKSDLTDVTVQLVHETEAAILVSDGDNQVWLPKSQCEYRTTSPGIIEVTLTERLATEKGLV
jgi:hypothetical protein